ncbi:MAG: hypothetical protein VX257_00680, partial [Planctomycetota bacterium]|nr:hypothetical protein [Planctomycetota bacterium]
MLDDVVRRLVAELFFDLVEFVISVSEFSADVNGRPSSASASKDTTFGMPQSPVVVGKNVVDDLRQSDVHFVILSH